MGVGKGLKKLKNNGLVAVTYDKVVCFCVMRKNIYENKQLDLLDSKQLSESKGTSELIVMKIENISKRNCWL